MSTNAKILLAEDEGIAARYLKQSLTRMGYEITDTVQSAEDVIGAVEENPPDLILMDISLGGKIDGITAAQKVRAGFDIPVIYVTGNTDSEVFERAKLTEPYAYLIKPYELSHLHNTIQIALFKHDFEKRLKESENRYRTLFDISDNAMMLINSAATITMINDQFAAMMGCSKEAVENKSLWTEFFTDDDRVKLEKGLQQALGGSHTTPGHFETTLIDKSGRSRIVYTNVKKFPGSDACLVSMNDVSELKQAEAEIRILNSKLNKTNQGLNQEITLRERVEKQLRYKATHDYLTGLPNRVLLFDRLKQAIAFEERHNTLIALMVLDLDNFKNINDTLGHLSGDILLKKVSQGLQKCMRQYDTVGRLGGDEFVIIVNDAKSIQDIITFAEKVQGVFQEPFDILGQPTYVTTSIGVAVFPLHGSTIEALLRKADMAMYVAKKEGRNTFRFFADSMDLKESDQNIMRSKRRITQMRESAEARLLTHVEPTADKKQVSH